MSDIWTTLEKELAVNGIELVNNKVCKTFDNGVLRTKSVLLKIKEVDREIRKNRVVLEDTLLGLYGLAREADYNNEASVVDVKSLALFIHSLKAVSFSLRSYMQSYTFKYKEGNTQEIFAAIRSLMDRDSVTLGKHVILGVPDYKLTIDWLVRNLNKLSYLKRLLLMAFKGQTRIDKYFVKVARGVQGPWANLDLPMQERAFEWADIEEEVRGRDRDIRKQRRYRMGFDHYNDYSKKSGEGFYWVEMNNEPYLWSERGDNSPYTGRSSLMNWG